VDVRGAHCLCVVRALSAHGSVIAADAAATSDGKLACSVLRIGGGTAESSTSGAVCTEDGHGRWGGYGAMGEQLQGVLRIAGDGACRVCIAQQPRFVAETGVGAEEAGAGCREAMKVA
jgi:hypothetical protein